MFAFTKDEVLQKILHINQIAKKISLFTLPYLMDYHYSFWRMATKDGMTLKSRYALLKTM